MSYTAALSDLRMFISDDNEAKQATNKKFAVGSIDGVNQVFYTYDKKLISSTLDVLVDGVTAPFTLDDATRGKVTITTAPNPNQKVTANYYWQWWLDDELTNFLNKAAEAVGLGTDAGLTDYLQIPPGLRTAALNFAGAYANRALVQYMVNRKHSAEFLIEQDANSDSNDANMIKALQDNAKVWLEAGVQLRDDFYKRQGRRNAPAFGVKTVNTRNYGPQR